MNIKDTPNNGDFASFIQEKAQSTPKPTAERMHSAPEAGPSGGRLRQAIEDVLVHGEEPTDDFLEEWNELQNLPELSDEELAQQALNAPGDDGDINTPE